MRSDPEALTLHYVPARLLEPNPWNPNQMDEATFAAEVASIKEFGFVDPIIVREMGEVYQIIDGYHRWKAATDIGYDELPIVVLDVDEDAAKELTIILNETRGRAVPERLEALVRDLASRRDRGRLDDILPFDTSHLDQMLAEKRQQVDWSELEQRRSSSDEKDEGETWVEKTYRMPAAAALVIEEAIERVKEMEEVPQDWRALEMVCADFLGT